MTQFLNIAPASLTTLSLTDREKTAQIVQFIQFDRLGGFMYIKKGTTLDPYGAEYYFAVLGIDTPNVQLEKLVGVENVELIDAVRVLFSADIGSKISLLSFTMTPGLHIVNDGLGNQGYLEVGSFLSNELAKPYAIDRLAPTTQYGDNEYRNFSGTPLFTADILVGGDGDDALMGLLGNDRLFGRKGSDELYGGYANDNLYGEDGSDNLYGEQGNDRLEGGDGDDFLDGGLGADTMIGGAGNDTYIVDHIGDIVNDLGITTDIDIVLLRVPTLMTYILPANIEEAELTGRVNSSLTGNSLDNVLIGNNGNNTLNGGLGGDYLAGGRNNDTYIIDNAADVVDEYAGEGTDTVESSIAHTLFANVENVTLTGTAAINATGNSAGNRMIGNPGNNILIGSTGVDVITGGLGVDTFRFAFVDSRLGAIDQITDFAIGTDILDGPTIVTAAYTKELGRVAILDQARIAAVLTTSVFAANQAATFSFLSGTTTRTYLAINDATAGFSSSDGLIDITGFKGLLTNLSIA